MTSFVSYNTHYFIKFISILILFSYIINVCDGNFISSLKSESKFSLVPPIPSIILRRKLSSNSIHTLKASSTSTRLNNTGISTADDTLSEQDPSLSYTLLENLRVFFKKYYNNNENKNNQSNKQNKKSIEIISLKNELYQKLSKYEPNGLKAKLSDQVEVDELVSKLELLSPTKDPARSTLMNGFWKMLYTDFTPAAARYECILVSCTDILVYIYAYACVYYLQLMYMYIYLKIHTYTNVYLSLNIADECNHLCANKHDDKKSLYKHSNLHSIEIKVCIFYVFYYHSFFLVLEN